MECHFVLGHHAHPKAKSERYNHHMMTQEYESNDTQERNIVMFMNISLCASW